MTKNFLLLLVFSLASPSFSQIVNPSRSNLKLIRIGFDYGQLIDGYTRINLATMKDWTQNSELIERDFSGHQADYSRYMKGMRCAINVTLAPFAKEENTYSKRRELRFGIYYSTRRAYLNYDQQQSNGGFSSIRYQKIMREIGLEGAYLSKHIPDFAKWFSVHGGLGLTIGTSFFDETTVSELQNTGEEFAETTWQIEDYAGRSSLITHVYVPVGFGFSLADNVYIGLEGSLGIGVQKMFNGSSQLIPLSVSYALKLGYYFD